MLTDDQVREAAQTALPPYYTVGGVHHVDPDDATTSLAQQGPCAYVDLHTPDESDEEPGDDDSPGLFVNTDTGSTFWCHPLTGVQPSPFDPDEIGAVEDDV